MAAADPRVRLLTQTNGGVASARNRALEAATGDFVAPLDADDIWRPSKIERQLRRMAADPRAGVVYCWSANIDAASRVIARSADLDAFEGDVYAALVHANFVGNASVPLLRRSLALEVGGWDPTLRLRDAQGCEDWQFCLRLAEVSPFALEPAFLVGYRQTPGAMSRRLDQMRRSYDLVMADARRRVPPLPARVWRWSRSEFSYYLADLFLERGDRRAALGQLVLGAALDPASMTLATFRGRVRACFTPARVPGNRVHFSQIAEDRDTRAPDGLARDRKRRSLAAIRLTAAGLHEG